MKHLDRRQFLELSAAGIGGAAIAGGLPSVASAADASPFKPEKGASLQLLRWTAFVPSDQTIWDENTKKFTAATGVPVQIQSLSWNDMGPKGALAAQVGSGPDIIMGWNDDPFVYPDKLVDMTDLVENMGRAHGGWYDNARSYCYDQDVKRWVSLPVGCTGNAVNYRKSWVKEAGFNEFPKDLDGMLKLARVLKKNGHPPGFSLGHAVGDANSWTHWILWAFGGKQANPDNSIAINSAETVNALDYARQLSETFIDGVAGWDDSGNNKAFAGGRIGMTMNGISIWYNGDQRYARHLPGLRQRDAPDGTRQDAHGLEQLHLRVHLQVQQVPERGEGVSPLHARQAAGRALGQRDERLRHARSQGVRRAADLDVESQHHAVSRRAREREVRRVQRQAGQGCGASARRVRDRRHVRRRVREQDVRQGCGQEGGKQAADDLQARVTSRSPLLARLDSPRVLGYLLITPAAIILLGLLAYPLLLGVWLSLTSTTIGKAGEFIGLQNYATIFADPIFRGAALFSVFYTVCAEVGKLILGLALALLLNQRFRGYRISRALMLLPWVAPTVLSALAWLWLLDPQYSAVSWLLIQLHLIHSNIDFLGSGWGARFSLIVGEHLARSAVLCDRLPRGAASGSPRTSTRPLRSTAPTGGRRSAASRGRC